MNQEVIIVPPDCPLEEAASLMVKHKIGSLPVVKEGRVVSIITETDIFKQFAAVLGGGTDSLRLTVQVPNVPGQLAELAGRIAQVSGNISSVVAYNADQPERINITLRVEGAGRGTVLEAVSGQAGLNVLHVWGGKEYASVISPLSTRPSQRRDAVPPSPAPPASEGAVAAPR